MYGFRRSSAEATFTCACRNSDSMQSRSDFRILVDFSTAGTTIREISLSEEQSWKLKFAHPLRRWVPAPGTDEPNRKAVLQWACSSPPGVLCVFLDAPVSASMALSSDQPLWSSFVRVECV